MLPASLTLLKIRGFPNLERLSSSMYHQNLSSLKLNSNAPQARVYPPHFWYQTSGNIRFDGRKVQRGSRTILAFVNPYTSRQYKIDMDFDN